MDIIKYGFDFFRYIKRFEKIDVSFYKLEKPEAIETIYNEKNGVIVFKDIEGFNTQEQSFKDKTIYRLKEKLQEEGQTITILVGKNRETVLQAFEKNEVIKENLFQFEIFGTNPDAQDVYQEILKVLKENSRISDDFEVALLDYVSATYPKTLIPFPEYRDSIFKKILFNKKDIITKEDIPNYEKEKTTK